MFKTILAVVLSIALTACAGMTQPNLDTNEKKLAAAEITFVELVDLALTLEPRLSADSKARVKDLIDQAHVALVLARQALDIGNLIDFESSLSTVRSTISVLRPILEELEKQEVSYGRSIKYSYTA